MLCLQSLGEVRTANSTRVGKGNKKFGCQMSSNDKLYLFIADYNSRTNWHSILFRDEEREMCCKLIYQDWVEWIIDPGS